MFIAYHYCGGISYGYVKKIINKYLLLNKAVYVINFDSYPSPLDLFIDFQVDKKKENLILLNFKKDNKNQLKDLRLNLLEYVLLDKEDNCYYYKKKK
jgi:hypothetical protein